MAVLSDRGAALATDSPHVALTPPAVMSTGFVKHVRVGARAAGIVGVADFEGHLVSAWVTQALNRAGTLPETPDEVLRAGGRDLVDAYLRWRDVVGPGPDADEFLSVLVVGNGPGGVEALTMRATVVGDTLTMVSDTVTPGGETRVLVIGAADATLLAHTDDGRTLRVAQQLQNKPLTVPAVRPLGPGLTSAECGTHARDLVAGAIGRERGLPRPDWWPSGLPVLAGPVHCVEL